MFTVIVTERCYKFLKSYVNLVQSQDNLCKSFDERILELLSAQIKLSDFRKVTKYIKQYISGLKYTLKHSHLFLRDITDDYLIAYCCKHGYRDFNYGVYHLIRRAVNQVAINNLQQEYEEVMH